MITSTGKVDAKNRTVIVKIKGIEESLELVKENLPKDLESFLNLGLIKDGIYKRVEFCIQNVLDICAVINSDLKLGVPSSEEEVVEHLVENRIFLVHRYGKIDDEIAYENMVKGLENFYKFIDKRILQVFHKNKTQRTGLITPTPSQRLLLVLTVSE